MIVYLATNTVNGMQYVGVTVKKLKYRKNGHLHDAIRGKGSKSSIQEAIRNYGMDKILFKKIDEACDYTDLRQKEMSWIERLNTLSPNGYNLNKGGNVWGEIKNKTYKHKFVVEGKTYHGMGALADAFGLTKKTIECRLKSNLGWSLRQIVGLDPAPKQVPVCAKEITYKGVTYPSQRHLVRALSPDLSPDTFRHRLENGMSIKEALKPEKIIGLAREVKAHGRTFKTVKEAAKFAGISSGTLLARLYAGWSEEDAVSPKVRENPVTVFGIKYKNKIEMCKHLGVDYETFLTRLNRVGVTVEQAVTGEKTKYQKRLEFTVDEKTFDTKKDAAKHYGINPVWVSKRLRRGWTPEQAVGLEKKSKQGAN
jgi:group I intron endonuclease